MIFEPFITPFLQLMKNSEKNYFNKNDLHINIFKTTYDFKTNYLLNIAVTILLMPHLLAFAAVVVIGMLDMFTSCFVIE